MGKQKETSCQIRQQPRATSPAATGYRLGSHREFIWLWVMAPGCLYISPRSSPKMFEATHLEPPSPNSQRLNPILRPVEPEVLRSPFALRSTIGSKSQDLWARDDLRASDIRRVRTGRVEGGGCKEGAKCSDIVPGVLARYVLPGRQAPQTTKTLEHTRPRSLFRSLVTYSWWLLG